MQFSSWMGQVSKRSYLRQRRVNDDDYQIETASSIPVWLPFVFATQQRRK